MFVVLHNRKLNRWNRWNYSENGWYYVTICVEDRMEIFGKIVDGKMQLNEVGLVAAKYWEMIRKIYIEVELDEFVIMPNHIHGILIIGAGRDNRMVGTGQCQNRIVGTGQCPVRTDDRYGKISKVINGYKNVVTKEVRYKLGIGKFEWHRSFYDNIIRTEKDLEKIRWYIRNNPKMWDRDRNKI